MRDEIGERHLAGHDKLRQMREQAKQRRQAAEGFDKRCEDDQAGKRRSEDILTCSKFAYKRFIVSPMRFYGSGAR